MKEISSPPPHLKERYRLVKWLGQGGMGTVYQAHDERLERNVAIKFLSPRQIANQEASARFLREARTIARLSHPNIMTLYDVDREGDWHYLILEYIPGQDLHLVAAERGGALPLPETLHTMQGVLEALAYAHGQGVVHRDIKPENMMITPAGQVKVTDFGLSLVQGEVRLTREDTIVGSVLYLAPEVIEGGEAGVRADLYALGAVFYELLTGQPPFAGDNFAAMFAQIINKPIIPPRALNPTIPEVVEQIVLKLLAKNPNERYASAGEVLAALPGPSELDSPTGQTVQLPRSTSLLERIIRNSSSGHQRPLPAAGPGASPPADELPAHLPDALLVYAALEDTTIAVEAERRRLAQLLASDVLEPLNLLLAQANTYEQTLGSNPAARMAVSVLISLARQIIQQTRDLEANLHPSLLETLGLEPALEALANQISRAHGLHISLGLERMPNRLPASIELALYRAAQEALQETVQQAHASQVVLQLKQEADHLVFQLADNGRAVTASRGDRLLQARPRIEQLGGTIDMGLGPQGGLEVTIRFSLVDPASLTPRELEVIQLLVEGFSNKEIARLLSIRPRTVNFHLDNIYAKLNINSRTEAAIYALRQGWVRGRL
jgi:serine/threonine protein kinase/DNA-binding NarL/FixJ family response regulator